MENSPKHFLTYFMRVLLFWCIQGFRNERLPWNMTSTLMSVELQQDSASNEDVLLLFIRETQNFTKLRPKETLCVNTLFKTSPSRNITLMFCAIWYHLHNLKNVKSTHGGVLFLLKLQASLRLKFWSNQRVLLRDHPFSTNAKFSKKWGTTKTCENKKLS